MAIYRSDQAVVTFGAEAALGGHPERCTQADAGSGTGAVATATEAGTFAISVDNGSGAGIAAGFAAGAFMTLGSNVTNMELRKIVGRSGSASGVAGNTTLYLDAPTGFYHPDNAVAQVVTAFSADTDTDKFITYLPGVYDTVTVPDMTPTIEPRYFLGAGSKRNFTAAYKGTQSYNGSVPSFILLNAAALRFPFGTMTTSPSASSGTITAVGASKKGDTFISFDGTDRADLIAGDYFEISGQTGALSDGSYKEVCRIVSKTGTSTVTAQLSTPLRFDHVDDSDINEITHSSSIAYTHTITESNVLDSIAMNVHMRDSGETTANDFDRRFFGGKVGAATLSAEEGGLLVMGWDSIPFMGGVHNQKLDPNSSITGGDVPFYGLTRSIASDNVGAHTGASSVLEYPTTDPYYFSQGTVSLFGTEFARVRNFTLNVNNNVEPRYYVERRGDSRLRGPSDIVEMRREYTMDATIALPDTVNSATSDTTSLFKQLMMEGDYGAGMKGFNIQLVFTRGTNDTITIDIPDDGASTGAAVGLDEQGAYLTEAPHPIDGSNPYEVSASMMFRNLKITVVDNVPLYP